MADPFSAVVQKLSRRDSTSLLIALFLGYALVAFGLGATVAGLIRWLAAITGSLSFTAGIAAFGYAFLLKPERLRAEETVRMDMMLTWLSRPDIDDEHRASAERLLPLVVEPKQSKRAASLSQGSEGDHG